MRYYVLVCYMQFLWKACSCNVTKCKNNQMVWKPFQGTVFFGHCVNILSEIGDNSCPLGDVTHPHRGGSDPEQGSQMCGVHRELPAPCCPRAGLDKSPALLELIRQEEEATQEEAQSRAAQGGADVCRRRAGAVWRQLRWGAACKQRKVSINWTLIRCLETMLLILFSIVRASSLSIVKDNVEQRQHSPLSALEWDSYPFSDGDWSPCPMYELLTPCTNVLTPPALSHFGILWPLTYQFH